MNSIYKTKQREMMEKIRSWLILIRLPNLFTVPGDIFAGYFLVFHEEHGHSRITFFMLLAVSILIYVAGIIFNDWFDRHNDLIKRPNRPLVSGKIDPSIALITAICLLVVALIIAAYVGTNSFMIAAILILLVIFYNSFARRIPAVSFLTMGLCRGVNIILGASIIWPHIPLFILKIAIIEACYITAVTMSAYHESEKAPKGISRWLPPLVLLAGFTWLIRITSVDWISIFAVLAAIGIVLWASISMKKDLPPSKVQYKIGVFIHSLILIQAAFIFLGRPESIGFVIILYLLWPFCRFTGRIISGS